MYFAAGPSKAQKKKAVARKPPARLRKLSTKARDMAEQEAEKKASVRKRSRSSRASPQSRQCPEDDVPSSAHAEGKDCNLMNSELSSCMESTTRLRLELTLS